jgi:medium-chain acyl-[acyl-carrier-protein] hydrolase
VLSSNPWVEIFKPQDDAIARLICFPFAGGSVQAFRDWQDGLPRGIELCAVQLPGREMRQRETPLTSAAQIVDAVLPALLPLMDRPFFLYGHSMGAIVAFELARRLQNDDGPAPECLIVSGRVAPHRSLTRDPINHLSHADFVNGLRLLGGTPQEVLDDTDLMSLIEPMLRADLAVHENYQYGDETKLTCDVVAFGALRDTEAGRRDVDAWRDVTQGAFRLQMMPGGHFFIRTAKALFLRALSIELRKVLARSSLPERQAS